MAEEDESQKTEEPSQKKLAKARGKGQVAQSQEIKTWVILISGTLGIVTLAPWMAAQTRLVGYKFIEQGHNIALDPGHLQLLFLDTAMELLFILGPLAVILVVMAIAGNVAQFGFIWTTEKVQPKLSKISVLKGFKRLFSMRTVVEFIKGIFKLCLVAGIAFAIAIPLVGDLQLVPFLSIADVLDRIYWIAVFLAASTVAVMTVIAIADFLYQKHAFTKQMRMSKQEVKEEYRQAEGDPLVKAKIRSLRQQRARQRMMAEVPKADVVITNPTHYAVALKYKMEEMDAPVCVAKGLNEVALRIRQVAEEHEIPVVENPPLARVLYSTVELEDEIPSEHFVAVAEVIGYVMRLKGQSRH